MNTNSPPLSDSDRTIPPARILIPDQVQGLIFDCDGTLADTMPAHFRAWQATLSPRGLVLTEDDFYGMGGTPTRDVARRVLAAAGCDDVSPEELTIEKEGRFLDGLHHVRPIECIVEVAQRFHGRIPVAVATGGIQRVCRRILEQIGVLHLFPVIVAADDVTRHKPDPDVFLEAARRINVSPDRCFAFEDTNPGLEAARRAGMPAFDVRTRYQPARVTRLG